MEKSSARASIGLCDILLVAFVVLKLLGVITWSWAWVLAPFWIPVAIVLVCIAVLKFS